MADRLDTCDICDKRLKHRSTGRPRITCSDRCRQIRRRLYDYHGWRDPRARARRYRDAERALRRMERDSNVFIRPAPISDVIPPDSTLSLRQRLLLRLQRGIKVPQCTLCWKPYLSETGIGGFCSPPCRAESRRRADLLQAALTEWADHYDPRVNVRLDLGLPIKTCDHCRQPFPDYVRKKRFCSDACRYRHHYENRHRGTRKCIECGTRYTPDLINASRQRFCSSTCGQRYYWREKHPPGPKRRHCRQCGRSFKINKYRRSKHRYCSDRCSDRARRSKP